MSSDPARPRARFRPTLLCLLSFLALLAAYWVVFAIDREFHQRWLRGEDRLYEWLTFAGFLGAGAVLLSALRFRASMSRWSRAYIAGLALFFLVCAGEEISWGQRILGFGTPEGMQEVNEQQEFNLHNLRIEHIHPYDIVSVMMAIFGILLPLATLAPRAGGDAWRRYVAPPWLMPCFVLAAALSPIQRALRPAITVRFGSEVALVTRLDSREMTEAFWGLGCLLAALSLRAAWCAQDGGEGGDERRTAGR
jgi:hypothetical protein